MDLSFSIYNIFNVFLRDIPDNIYPFLRQEYEYFQKELSAPADLEIRFVESVDIPEDSRQLAEDFFYKNGTGFLRHEGSVVQLPFKDIISGRILVLLEKNVSQWIVLYVIEKLLHLKVIEKGYCFFHAAGYVSDGSAVLRSASQEGGKTQWVLEQLRKNKEFLGDDLILVDRQGHAYAYPRGLNIHIFHGGLYKRALRLRFSDGIYLIHWAKLEFLKLLVEIFFKKSILGERVNKKIKARSLLRMHIKELIPDAVIAGKAKLKEIQILSHDGSSVLADALERSDKSKAAQYLIENITIERLGFVGDFVDSFLSVGDNVSRAFKTHVERLMAEERDIVSQVLDKSDVKQLKTY